MRAHERRSPTYIYGSVQRFFYMIPSSSFKHAAWQMYSIQRTICHSRSRFLSSSVRIVEVGPRDGLQNESLPIPPAVKAELINRLSRAGMRNIEAGSFVSPKWVPQVSGTPGHPRWSLTPYTQMAGTSEVLSLIEPMDDTNYSVLIPNQKGLNDALSLLSGGNPPPVTEIAVFSAATDAFSKANTNVTVATSLARLAPVVRSALDAGLKVRGYVSVIITCPYSGRVDPRKVRDVARELLQMGCYEVSLGDTTGAGTPASLRLVLEEVGKDIDVGKMAGHVCLLSPRLIALFAHGL